MTMEPSRGLLTYQVSTAWCERQRAPRQPEIGVSQQLRANPDCHHRELDDRVCLEGDSLDRLHSLRPDDWEGTWPGEKLDQLARRLRGLRIGTDPGGKHDVVLNLRRQRPHQLDPRRCHDLRDDDDAEFDFPLGHKLGNDIGGWYRSLRFDRIGNSESIDQLRYPSRLDIANGILALSRAPLNASTEPMSGFGAPPRTATPKPDRTRFVRVSATTWPSLTNASMVDGGLTTTSKGSPALIRFTKTGLNPEITSRAWPFVCSNSRPIFSSTVAIALEVKILTSAAPAKPL